MNLQTRQKFLTFFDQWQVDQSDNLDVQQIKDRFLELPKKMNEAAVMLEPYFQVWMLSQAIQMVIGGLKPATSISIDRNLIVEYQKAGLVENLDFSKMHRVLYEIFGLRVTEKIDGFAEDKMDYFIYNPDLLKKLSLKYNKLSMYDGGDINAWIRESHQLGSPDYVYGMLYGYPVSAVKQFAKYQTFDNCRLEGRRIINTYGEAYVVWGEKNKRDVLIRERIKESFFTHLADQQLYMDLIRMLQLMAKDYRRVSQYSFEKMISYSHLYKL